MDDPTGQTEFQVKGFQSWVRPLKYSSIFLIFKKKSIKVELNIEFNAKLIARSGANV